MDKKTLGIIIGVVAVVVVILIIVIAIIIVKNKKSTEETTDSQETDTKESFKRSKESFSRMMFVEGAKQKRKEPYTPAVSNADKRVKDALDKWSKF